MVEDREKLGAGSEREEFLERLITRSKDGIIVISRDGTIRFTNPAAERMFSSQTEELVGYQIGMPAIEDDVELQIPLGGELRYIEMRVSELTWEGELADLAMLRDITDRKAVEGRLKHHKDLLLETGQMARVGGWEINFEAETVWWSEVTRDIHGVSEEYEPTLEEAIEFFPSSVRPRLREAIRRAREDLEPYDMELPFVTAEGEELWVHTIGNAERLPDGRVRVHGTFQDITESYKTQKLLRESERKYRQLFTHSINGFALHEIVTDDQGEAVDYVYLDVNQAFEQHTGLKSEEVIGKPASEIFAGTEERELLDIYASVARTGDPVQFDFYSPQLDRHYLIAAFSPREGQFATSFYDISERVQTEEALRKSEQKFRTLFESMAQGVVYQNAQGEIISANPAAERILGLTLDQMQGRTSMDPEWQSVTLDGNPLPGDQHPAMVALRTGEKVENHVFGVYQPDKEEHVWISASSTPQFKEGEEEPYQVFTTFLDITDRVKAEQELKERVKELRCIAAVGEMIQRGPSLEQVGQTTVDLLIPAMQYPSLTAAVVEIEGQRFESDRFHPGLDHRLRAGIGHQGDELGHVTVYYTSDRPFIIPEEQNLLNQIAEMLTLWYEQAKANRRLREREEELDLAIQSAELGIWDWNIPDDAMSFNEIFIEMFGYDMDEVSSVVDFWGDQIHPQDLDRVQEAVRAHMDGETPIYQSQYRLQTASGDWVHTLDTGKIIQRNQEGDPVRFMGIHQDITDLVRAEEHLRFQASLLDAVGQAVIATDAEGRINYWNQAAEELYGWPAEEISGKQILDVTPAEGMEDQAEEIMTTLMAGEMWSGEFEVQRKNGSSFPAIITDTPIMNDDGELVGIIGVTTDISERVEAEQSRLRTERRFRALIENAQDMIAVMDREGVIKYSSPSVEQVLGYTPVEIQGADLFAYIHPDDLPDVMNYFGELVGDFGESHRLEFRVKHKEGGWRMIESVAHNALDESGVEGIIVNSRDITERFQYEQVIKKQVEQLSIQHEIASMGVEIMDEDVVIQETTRLIDDAFSPHNCGVFLLDENEGVIKSHSSYLVEGQNPPLSLDLGEGVIGSVIASGESWNVSDVDEVDEYIPLDPNINSELCVPMKTGVEVFGVINVESSERGRFSEDDRRALEAIANQLATTLSNIRSVTAAKRRMDRLQVLRDIDQAISGSLDLKTTLSVMADRILQNLEVDACSVLLYQPQLQTLEYEIGAGFRTEEISGATLRLGEDFAGKAVLERKMIAVSDLMRKTVRTDFLKFVREEGFEEYIGVPLIAKGEVIGVLEIFHRSALNTTPEWLEFLETLAGQAAIAIDRLDLFNELQRANIDLRMAYNNVIEGWSRALELRDQETEGHSRRVEQLTLEIARRKGLKGDELLHIRQGALLHDIGKMGVPDEILMKPGKLTEEDWKVMKKHPTFAYNMLSPIEHLKPALDIPYCHHEKWDGSGYPRGLEGEEIPLAARIFAVVDVWDALRSDRPYRDAWSDEKALAYIKEQSGSHFDPQVVSVFMDVIGENE